MTWQSDWRLWPDRGVHTDCLKALLMLGLHAHMQRSRSVAPHVYVSDHQHDCWSLQPDADEYLKVRRIELRTLCIATCCRRGCGLTLLRPPSAAAVHCMHGACAAIMIAKSVRYPCRLLDGGERANEQREASVQPVIAARAKSRRAPTPLGGPTWATFNAAVLVNLSHIILLRPTFGIFSTGRPPTWTCMAIARADRSDRGVLSSNRVLGGPFATCLGNAPLACNPPSRAVRCAMPSQSVLVRSAATPSSRHSPRPSWLKGAVCMAPVECLHRTERMTA
jgi:hypothetical protein